MTTFQMKKQQAGITLIEVSIGLIIAAIVAAVAFIAFQNNSRRNEVRENVTALTEIIAEAKQKFGRTSTFGSLTGTNGVDDPAVVSATIPRGIVDTGNSYGAKTTLFGSSAAGVADATATAGFATLVWGNVPANQCYDLVLALAPASTDIKVNATNVTANAAAVANGATGNSVYTSLKLDPAKATTECDALKADDGKGTISFTFNRG